MLFCGSIHRQILYAPFSGRLYHTYLSSSVNAIVASQLLVAYYCLRDSHASLPMGMYGNGKLCDDNPFFVLCPTHQTELPATTRGIYPAPCSSWNT